MSPNEVTIVDSWTLQLEALLLEIARAAQEHGKRYYFGGGFALDCFLGRLTRPHDDLDFFPMEEETRWWKDWFAAKGYLIGKDPDMEEFPYAFLVTNEQSDYIAGVYPVAVGEPGEISLQWEDAPRSQWAEKSWLAVKQIQYKGVTITFEDPQSVLVQKLAHASEYGIPLSAKHRHDLELFES